MLNLCHDQRLDNDAPASDPERSSSPSRYSSGAKCVEIPAVHEARLRTQRKITKLPQAHSLEQIVGFASSRVMPGEACVLLAQEALIKIIDNRGEAGDCRLSLHSSSPSADASHTRTDLLTRSRMYFSSTYGNGQCPYAASDRTLVASNRSQTHE
jgi:hypothetical protein